MIEIKRKVREHAGNVRKIKQIRFEQGLFEYRLEYDSPWVLIKRRESGGNRSKRYSYFSRVKVDNCWSFSDVMKKVEDKLNEGV